MTKPTQEDIEFRVDLALRAVDEVARTAKAHFESGGGDEIDKLSDVYRSLSMLSEATGHLALALKLLRTREEQRDDTSDSSITPASEPPSPYQGRRPSPGLDDR